MVLKAPEGPYLAARNADSNSTHASAGVGAILRGARLARGEDIQSVSSALRIRKPYLEAIEDGRAEDLPGLTYGIGFVRAYAEYMGLDVAETVARFKDEASRIAVKTHLQFPEPLPGNRVPGIALLVLVILMAGATYGGYLYSTSKNMTFIEAVEAVPGDLLQLLNGAADQETGDAVGGTEPSIETPTEETPTEEDPTGETPTGETPTGETIGEETGIAVNAAESEPGPAPVPEQATQPQTEADQESNTTSEPSEEATSTPLTPPDAPSDSAESAPSEGTADPGQAANPSNDDAATQPPSAEAPPTQQAASDPTSDPTSGPPQDRAALDPAEPVEAGAGAPSVQDTDTPSAPTGSENASSGGIEETNLLPPAQGDGENSVAADGTPPAPNETSASSASDQQIILQATNEVWIRVSDAQGNVLIEKLMLMGEIYRVPNRTGLTMETGNAGALKLIVNGEIAPPLGEIGEVRRGISLSVATLLGGSGQ